MIVMPHRFAVCLCLLAAAAPAAAGTLHVCQDARGVRSYQDTPCAPGVRNLGARAFEAKAPDPALLARTRAIEAEMDRRNRGGGSRIAAVRQGPRRPAAPSPCQAAKARREATLKRVGLKRDFDLLSRLDGEVWEVCKGF